MPTGPKKEPMDFQSLSAGLTSAANDFGEKLALQAEKFGKSMDKTLKNIIKKFKEKQEAANNSWIGKMYAKMKKGWNKFWSSGMGRVLKFIAAFAAVFIGVFVQAFKTFDAMMVTSGKQFGLMARDKGGLVGSVMEATGKLKYLGMGFSEIQGSITIAQNQLGLMGDDAIKFSTQLASTALNLGISNDEAAGLAVQFTRIMGLSKENAKNMIEGFGALAYAQGVSPSAVMKDIAQNTEFSAKFSKGMGTNILNASIQAKKLGVNLASVEKVMSGLLDFENSITKEMEASVLLGRQLNFGEARRLALMGDVSGAMGSILNQVGGQAAFDRMNVLERQALADAIGVSVGELAKFASGAEAAGAEAAYLEAEAKAAMEEAAEGARRSLSPITDMKAAMYNFWLILVQNLQPAFEAITKAINKVTTALQKYFDSGRADGEQSFSWLTKFQETMDKFVEDLEGEGGLEKAIDNLFISIKTMATNFFKDIIDMFTGETAKMLLIVGGVLTGLMLIISMFSKKAIVGAAAFGVMALGFAALAASFYFMKTAGIDGDWLWGVITPMMIMMGLMSALAIGLGFIAAKAAMGAGILLLIAGAIYIIAAAMEMLMPYMVQFAEIVGDVMQVALENMHNIIKAMADGFNGMLDRLIIMGQLDPGNIALVAGAYTTLALAVTAMGAANIVNGIGQVANGLGSIVGSIGDFISSGIDSLSDFLFGEDDVKYNYVTNQYEVSLPEDASFKIAAFEQQAQNDLYNAVATGVSAAMSTIRFELEGDKLVALLQESE